jgi:hypothetical protein
MNLKRKGASDATAILALMRLGPNPLERKPLIEEAGHYPSGYAVSQ